MASPVQPGIEPMPPIVAQRGSLGAGMVVAIISAAAFALSGPWAKALMESGWSPGAAVFVRIAGAAVILAIPAAVILIRSRGRAVVGHVKMVLGYGAIAIAGAQVGFFSAVQTLPVGVALLIEYVAPVMVVVWLWITGGQRPGTLTVIGGAVAMIGLVLVLNLTSAEGLNPVGVAWALWAALCLTGYFLLSAHASHDLNPLLLIGVGMWVAAAIVAVVAALGLLPFTFASNDAVIGGRVVAWWWPVLGLILVGSVFAYLTGLFAVRQLGARLASFVALIEVLFAVVFAWALLAELPAVQQLVGGVFILAGVVLVRLGEPALEE